MESPTADKQVEVYTENPTKKNKQKVPPLDFGIKNSEAHADEHPPTCMEKVFIFFGYYAAHHPWKHIIFSTIICLAMGSGFFTVLEAENRPEKQWVPAGAPALEQKDYVDATWPSTQRFNFWIAQCKEDQDSVKVGGGGNQLGNPGGGGKRAGKRAGKNCSLLEPKYVQRLQELNDKIMNIVVDGDEVKKMEPEYLAIPDETWKKWGYSGKFQFFENRTIGNEAKSKCFKFGPFCGKRTMLDIFRDDKAVIDSLTVPEIKQAVNFWEGQDNFCPISIAKLDSPCVDTRQYLNSANKLDCQKYKTTLERQNCRTSAQAYCDAKCPTICYPPGSPRCRPMTTGKCEDAGCLQLVSFNQQAAANAASQDNTTGSAPDSAFAFEPFKIKSVLSSGGEVGKQGPEMSGNTIVGAKAMFGFYALSDNKNLIDSSETDPISLEWEKKALCVLGIDYSLGRDPDYKDKCKKDDLLEFRPNFQRSFGDEFGNAIRGDVAKLGSSYVGILVFMYIMLSRRDSVHSMIFMGTMTVVIVGFSFIGCMGFGGYIGLPNNQLNNNIPFLLLGLGVDDAFVLSSEYMRAALSNKHRSIEDNIIMTARHGGISILITSATDALAFLVGSATVLPALSWFCQFAGFGVIICFILQITFFLPALALNAKRAKANRYDCCCCFKAKEEHPLEEEKGCCCCCNCKSGILPMILEKTGNFMTTTVGTCLVLILFGSLLGFGISGSVQVYKDFKLEWFFPDSSYVNEFFNWNNEFFQGGKPVTVYMRDLDYYAAQGDLDKLHLYLNNSKYVDSNEAIEDWHWEFSDSVRQTTSEWNKHIDAHGHFGEGKKDVYYEALHQWYADGGGVRYRTRLKWLDPKCENDTVVSIDANGDSIREWKTCDYKKGLEASRISATLALQYTNLGQDRYDTMTNMRKELGEVMKDHGGTKTFPYSFEFLYWEEVGIIDAELIRNLLICGIVVTVMIAILIPHPRIAIWVVLSIILSVIDLVGFMFYWDVTISGISTIYILISVGLAVDYSAHIAHMFVESTGTGPERAAEALKRIGPSVFNAVLSTMVAVIIIGFSESYVFRVFFKALFLTVLLGGAHGLLFLPTMLALFGGEKKPLKQKSPRNDQISDEEIEKQKQEKQQQKTVEIELTDQQ